MKITIVQQKLNITCIHIPEDCKSKDELKEFYEQVQSILHEIPHDEPLILMVDFNARIGNDIGEIFFPELERKSAN